MIPDKFGKHCGGERHAPHPLHRQRRSERLERKAAAQKEATEELGNKNEEETD